MPQLSALARASGRPGPAARVEHDGSGPKLEPVDGSPTESVPKAQRRLVEELGGRVVRLLRPALRVVHSQPLPHYLAATLPISARRGSSSWGIGPPRGEPVSSAM
jgi:hypothetical protein